MRELERDRLPLIILGAGRAGGSIAAAARSAGLQVTVTGRDDLDRGEPLPKRAIVLICVPDSEIEAASERLAPRLSEGSLVAHVSGATGLEALGAARERGAEVGSLHPLQTLPTSGSDLRGAACAIEASSAAALTDLTALAERLEMRPFELQGETRAAYHAAASMASNYIVTLCECAAGLMRAAGIDGDHRSLLAPLVERSAANWASDGADALTGPIARGDAATVARQREAIAQAQPELTELYDALASRTAAIAAANRVTAADLEAAGAR